MKTCVWCRLWSVKLVNSNVSCCGIELVRIFYSSFSVLFFSFRFFVNYIFLVLLTFSATVFLRSLILLIHRHSASLTLLLYAYVILHYLHATLHRNRLSRWFFHPAYLLVLLSICPIYLPLIDIVHQISIFWGPSSSVLHFFQARYSTPLLDSALHTYIQSSALSFIMTAATSVALIQTTELLLVGTRFSHWLWFFFGWLCFLSYLSYSCFLFLFFDSLSLRLSPSPF